MKFLILFSVMFVFTNHGSAQETNPVQNQNSMEFHYRITDPKACEQIYNLIAASEERVSLEGDPSGIYEVRHFNSSTVCYGLKSQKGFFKNWYPLNCFCDLTMK